MKKIITMMAAAALFVLPAAAQSQQSDRVKAAKDSLQQIKTNADRGDARSQCIVGNWYYTGQHVTKDYAKAFDYYSKSAAQKNTTAIGNLGLCYQYGNGVKADSVLAMKHYLRSMNAGNKPLVQQMEQRAGRGELFAAVASGLYYNGKGKDVNKSVAYLKKAADKGSVDAGRELALVFLNNRRGGEAFQWFEKGAANGDVTSIYYCGRMLREGGMGVKSDPSRALQFLTRASDLGFPAADYQLGQAYKLGLGVRKDMEKAREYYHRGTIGGNTNAAYQLAMSLIKEAPADYFTAIDLLEYSVPRGHAKAFERLFQPSDTTLNGSEFHKFLLGMQAYDKKDFPAAEKIFKSLDKKKLAQAKTMLALIQLNKDNPKRNLKKGVKTLEAAVKAGDARAMYALATLYETGTGVAVDKQRALELLLQSAEAGDFNALCRLGDIYYEGLLGESRDLTKAVDYYTQAGPLRNKKAADRLADCLRNGQGTAADAARADEVESSYAPRTLGDLTKHLR